MKLKAIRLADVGPFRAGVAVEAMSGGLDLLLAPNETGKSTIFRALSVLFREAHTAQNKTTRALQPLGGGSPTVEADFEIDGRDWRLTKRWFGQKIALLTDLSAGRTLRGADAEQQATALLAGNLDRSAMAGVLWVEQTAGFVLPSAQGEAGRALARLVDLEVAGATGAGQARRLRDEIGRRLDGLLTDKRTKARANTEYGRAVATLAELEDKHRDATLQANASADRRANLQRLRDERAEIERRRSDPQQAADLAAIDSALKAAEEAARELAKAEGERASAEARYRAADTQRKSLADTLADVARLQERLAGFRASREKLATEKAEAEAASKSAEERLVEARAAVVALRGQRTKAEERQRQLRQWQTLDDLTRRLALAETAEGERAAALAGALPIDEALVRQLRALLPQRDRLSAELTAAAPVISLRLRPDAAGTVRIDGETVAADAVVQALRPLTIDIAGVGTIVVAPAQAGDAADGVARLDALDRDIADLLGRLSVASLPEAEERLDLFRAARERADRAAAQLVAQAPDGLAALRTAHARLSASLTERPPEDTADTLAEIVRQLQRAESVEADAARHARTFGERLAEVRSTLAGAEKNADQLAADIAQREAVLPPEGERAGLLARLQADVTAAADALATATTVTQSWQRRVAAPEERQRLAQRRAAAEAAATASERRLGELDREIATIEGALVRDGETGSAALAGEVEVELEETRARVTRYQTEADALMLLDEVLAKVEREDEDALGRPVRARLETYAGQVLPGLEVFLGESFAVKSVHRFDAAHGPDLLSTGTIEQIGLLTRLAYGRLLADQGAPVPVVLDDPLAHADDDRLARVFGVLREAARYHQIVVLSCHQAAFAPLAASPDVNRLELSKWTPSL
jgi:energy-coupling factor transporter ATP-binding protein EcfA2